MKVFAKDLKPGMRVTNTNSGRQCIVGRLEDNGGRIDIYDRDGKAVSTTGKKAQFLVHED